MCYSAEVWAGYHRYEREFGARLSIRDFAVLSGQRGKDGKRVIKPMRYGCRPGGRPAWYDERYHGTYNTHRDNLEGFWKEQFGHRHALIVCKTWC